MYKNLLRCIAALVVGWSTLAAAQAANSAPTEAPAATRPPLKLPLRAAFVDVSPVGTAGWSYQHDLGRLAMEKNLGDKVHTTVVEGVAEGPDAERVMRDLAMALGIQYRRLPNGEFAHSALITLPDADGHVATRHEGVGQPLATIVAQARALTAPPAPPPGAGPLTP